MKIAAKIDDWTYLVEMKVTEMNKITGESRSTSTGYNDRQYKIGESFDPVKNFDYLKGLFEKKKQLFDTARNLRSMADMIESMQVPEEDAEKEGEAK
jgi:hypothetical protein